ncbi:DeoR/GlpR family DNA-binding transcription regulator [Carboxydochorda subterranea]|uniref:DeoR/GlpR family DNA-binding transcription regulator n=1 Tax=Carboxydichorda subterranea TaxID=3109565 RepID=A0ABZ1BYX1_9FIRM|nr:DeoR/GlpR family DNA-binding transcription regulator [Limnochorda sp. L945t]WRP17293.1 DeoR/GlpR family DNA-binding transcription regulator [Limnochorda sp. L945t]
MPVPNQSDQKLAENAMPEHRHDWGLGATALRETVVPAERRRRIVEFLRANRSAKNEELAAALGVSVATVRRDLDFLATQGLVSRTHGGAVLPESSTAYERLYSEKRVLFQDEKRRIGQAAAAMVADGETIILDTGSTTFQVAHHLAGHKNLTIITNDLLIAAILEFDPTTQLVVTGGIRRSGFSVLIGPITEDLLRGVKVNKSFLSADAVDLTHGISNATFAEAATKRLIIEAARQVVLVVDHSKFGGMALAKVAGLERIHHIITDSGVSPDVLQGLERLGVPVTVV